MRLLILTQYFPPEMGAAQTRLAAFARELIRLGNEVEVVTALPSHPAGRIFPAYRSRFYLYEEWEGVPTHRVWVYASLGKGIKRAINYASFTFTSLFGLLKAQKPDFIIVECPPPSLALPAVLASRLWRVPIILNVADLWPDSVRELGVLRQGSILRSAEALERWAYRNADFINAVTEGIWTSLVHDKGVPVRKLLRLYNGVDTELFRPMAPDFPLQQSLGLRDKKIVLYQGTLGYAHAVETTLRAAKLLSGKVDIHFVFLGNGSEKTKLIGLANELSLQNVTFLDIVPVEEVPRYLSIAWCGLVSLRDVPVLRGGRPAKMFPIMACAKPVVFYGPEGEASRVLREANAGVVAPVDDPQAVSSAIQEIINNPALAGRLGNNGRRYVEQRLTWSNLVTNWLTDLTQRQSQRTEACLPVLAKTTKL